MALSDKTILDEIKKGNIIIDPFDIKNLATSSYDVRLGEFYYREQKPKNIHSSYYNIYNKDDINKVWGEILQANHLKDQKKYFLSKIKNIKGIDPEDKIIILEPGETILAHTIEFIGGRNYITTDMQARSSIGRSSIGVCKCAGWGDVGFFNRWTMEITNFSRYYNTILVVGRRIAQIIFIHTGEILSKDYSKNGKYQTSENLEELKRNWKPETMLPQLHKDRDIKKS